MPPGWVLVECAVCAGLGSRRVCSLRRAGLLVECAVCAGLGSRRVCSLRHSQESSTSPQRRSRSSTPSGSTGRRNARRRHRWRMLTHLDSRALAPFFTVADGRAAGLSGRQLRRSELHSPTRGVWSFEPPHDLVTRARAVALALPETTAFSHLTAARLHGLPTSYAMEEDARLHIIGPIDEPQVRREGLVGHRMLHQRAIMDLLGLRVVDLADTWVRSGRARRARKACGARRLDRDRRRLRHAFGLRSSLETGACQARPTPRQDDLARGTRVHQGRLLVAPRDHMSAHVCAGRPSRATSERTDLCELGSATASWLRGPPLADRTPWWSGHQGHRGVPRRRVPLG